MNQFVPNTMYGWAGLALIAGTVAYHRSLGAIGLIIGFGAGIYLYFVMDDMTTASS